MKRMLPAFFVVTFIILLFILNPLPVSAQTSEKPTFGTLGPCPKCETPVSPILSGVADPLNKIPNPSTGMTNTNPATTPCPSSQRSVTNNALTTHWTHDGAVSEGAESIINLFLKLIVLLLQVLTGDPATNQPGLNNLPIKEAEPCPVAILPSAQPSAALVPSVAVSQPLISPAASVVPSQTQTPSAISLGAAIEPNQLDDNAFANALKVNKFTSLTPENAMKFESLEPTQGKFTWTGADKIVNFAQSNNMRVRGHNLVWHQALPGWVNGLSNAAAETALQNHIKTVVGKYKGKIAQWDVVNEAFNDNGTLRDTVWKQKLGNDYMEKAFKWAREADPSVKLFYNEFGAEGIADRGGNKKAKSDAVYNLVKDFKAKGIPIDGVGLQTHSAGDYPGTGPELTENIKRLRALGVIVEITELDVVNVGDQAARYAEIGTACKTGGCSGITTWGLYDGHTWLTGKNPLLLDANFKPKPAYTSLMQAIGSN